MSGTEDLPPPTVSIVVPCHNYGSLLPEALCSAIRQTHPTTEILVVDDGSTDETPDVVAGFDHQIGYVWQPNRGLASARNLGASRVKGEFIVFLDADDTLEPSYIEECLPPLMENPDLAFTYTQARFFGQRVEVSTHPTFSVPELLRGNYICATALLRTKLVQDNPYDTSFETGWEDWDFYLTLVEKGYRGQLVDKPLLNYRQHAGSMTASLREQPIARRELRVKIMRRHRRLYGHSRYYSEVLKLARLRVSHLLRRIREHFR